MGFLGREEDEEKSRHERKKYKRRRNREENEERECNSPRARNQTLASQLDMKHGESKIQKIKVK